MTTQGLTWSSFFLKERISVFLLLLGAATATEQTMRTTSSTDIQICVEGVLSDERDAMQIVATNTLTVGLASSAVYVVRRYTTPLGATCYLFVYQAPSPDVARKAGVLLAQLLPSATELPLVYKNTQIKVTACWG